MKHLVVLGSTGSIGSQTLALLETRRHDYQLVGLSAKNNHQTLLLQIKKHSPLWVAVENKDAAKILRDSIKREGLKTEVFEGKDANTLLLSHAQAKVVVCAMSGAVGVKPFLQALKMGTRVLFANKEALLLSGGALVSEAMKQGKSEIIPLDSEHQAAFSLLKEPNITSYPLLKKEEKKNLRRLIITASGGPFLGKKLEELHEITPEEACKHPNWSMGRKISVDSATLMNKALELIEAHELFGLSADELEVWIHRESLVHALWQGTDNTLRAAVSRPSMRYPIAYALDYPNFTPFKEEQDLMKTWHFEPMDSRALLSISLAKTSIQEKGVASLLLNAFNEVAVEAFLQQKIPFTKIHDWIHFGLDSIENRTSKTLEDRLFLHEEAQAFLRKKINAQAL